MAVISILFFTFTFYSFELLFGWILYDILPAKNIGSVIPTYYVFVKNQNIDIRDLLTFLTFRFHFSCAFDNLFATDGHR